jgi:hypothetical protein
MQELKFRFAVLVSMHHVADPGLDLRIELAGRVHRAAISQKFGC